MGHFLCFWYARRKVPSSASVYSDFDMEVSQNRPCRIIIPKKGPKSPYNLYLSPESLLTKAPDLAKSPYMRHVYHRVQFEKEGTQVHPLCKGSMAPGASVCSWVLMVHRDHTGIT